MIAPPARPARSARVLLGALLAAWTTAFVATHLPRGKVPDVHVSDKTLHAAGYFVLGGLFVLLLTARGARRWRRIVLALAAMSAYAAIDEITQPLVNRTASAGDWLADVLGAAAAVAACEAATALRRRLAPGGARGD